MSHDQPDSQPLAKKAEVVGLSKFYSDLFAEPLATSGISDFLQSLSVLEKAWSTKTSAIDLAARGLFNEPTVEVASLKAKIAKNEGEIARIYRDVEEKTAALQKALAEKADTEAEKKSLDQTVKELAEKLSENKRQTDLQYLIGRVNGEAKQKLLHDSTFVKLFEDTPKCNAFVLSIDIRRSTDLMLRGKSPALYAQFLDSCCRQLADAIKNNFGVLDKFTGDGLLAYFPDFFSGSDAGFYCVRAATECHGIFADEYRKHRNSFTVLLNDVGLGIGIDYGEVHLMRVTSELTVLGAPVVYACRFSGAPAGCTYVNHSALEAISAKESFLTTKEVNFDVKNEGTAICHSVDLIPSRYAPTPPAWTDAAKVLSQQLSSPST